MKRSPRDMAVHILNRVDHDNSYAQPLLDRFLSRETFESIQDRRLLTQIVYGTLRMRNHLDWVIHHFYTGRSAPMETGLKNILRTALYQIMFLDRVPSFAAVDEAVKITKKSHPGRSGLVNAILRNAIRKMSDVEYPDIEGNPTGHLSIVHSHPRWMVERWLEIFGVEETLALCESNNRIPPLTLRVNPLKAGREDIMNRLLADGNEIHETQYSRHGITMVSPSAPIATMPSYRDGFIQVQDEASQLISVLLNPQRGDTILDLCSGAGIKTTHLAELMQNTGIIVALDINKTKIAALKELSRRLGITNIDRHIGDAANDLGPHYHGKFDGVLVDAPCSGTGTLRRNPEIKWRLQASDIKKSSLLQKNILHSSARYPKKGGTLIYSTCSIETEENENVVREFLNIHPEFERIAPPPHIEKTMVTRDGFFRAFPHRHGTDGFFAAILLRKE